MLKTLRNKISPKGADESEMLLSSNQDIQKQDGKNLQNFLADVQTIRKDKNNLDREVYKLANNILKALRFFDNNNPVPANLFLNFNAIIKSLKCHLIYQPNPNNNQLLLLNKAIEILKQYELITETTEDFQNVELRQKIRCIAINSGIKKAIEKKCKNKDSESNLICLFELLKSKIKYIPDNKARISEGLQYITSVDYILDNHKMPRDPDRENIEFSDLYMYAGHFHMHLHQYDQALNCYLKFQKQILKNINDPNSVLPSYYITLAHECKANISPSDEVDQEENITKILHNYFRLIYDNKPCNSDILEYYINFTRFLYKINIDSKSLSSSDNSNYKDIPQDSKKAYQKSLDKVRFVISKISKNKITLNRYLNNNPSIIDFSSNPQDEIDNYLKTLDFFKNQPLYEVKIHQTLSRLYEKINNSDKAIEHYHEELNLYNPYGILGNYPAYKAKSCENLVRLYEEKGQYATAAEYLNQAYQIYRSNPKEYPISSPILSASLKKLARLYEQSGIWDEAIKYLELFREINRLLLRSADHLVQHNIERLRGKLERNQLGKHSASVPNLIDLDAIDTEYDDANIPNASDYRPTYSTKPKEEATIENRLPDYPLINNWVEEVEIVKLKPDQSRQSTSAPYLIDLDAIDTGCAAANIPSPHNDNSNRNNNISSASDDSPKRKQPAALKTVVAKKKNTHQPIPNYHLHYKKKQLVWLTLATVEKKEIG